MRERVIAASGNRCGYCQTAQRVSGAKMHIDHITPIAHGGTSDETNLCLSCAWCNSYKAAKTHADDPVTRATVSLFNPRTERWVEHFRWSDDGIRILCLTAVGRATIIALRMNNEFILPARRLWASAGWPPPAD